MGRVYRYLYKMKKILSAFCLFTGVEKQGNKWLVVLSLSRGKEAGTFEGITHSVWPAHLRLSSLKMPDYTVDTGGLFLSSRRGMCDKYDLSAAGLSLGWVVAWVCLLR